MTELLRVENLRMHFPISGGVLGRTVGKVYAVDGVSFSVNAGETVGVVGESGCGKTTVGRSLLRIYNPTSGKITFAGQDITKLKGSQMRPLRKKIQMIFQDPYESLNSRQTVRSIVQEPLDIFGIGEKTTRLDRVKELIDRVGLSERSLEKFPHEFSGGQRQRIGIARAIALNPELIVCDEPVSALDVSIQSQVLNLLLELQQERNLSYVFIAHDLAVVKHVSDKIAVMYLGKIVEFGNAEEVYKTPLHPYTKALIAAIPLPDPSRRRKQWSLLQGEVPSPIFPPSGCHFHTRCPHAKDICRQQAPELEDQGQGQQVACHFTKELS